MIDPSHFKILDFQQPVFTVISDRLYKLIQDYVVFWDYAGVTFRITIPAGDETDGASTPPWTSMLGITPVGLAFGPAVIHDRLYSCQGRLPEGLCEIHDTAQWRKGPSVWSRADCDVMFKTLLLAAGVSQWKALLMYSAVRSCGWLFWDRTFKTAAN